MRRIILVDSHAGPVAVLRDVHPAPSVLLDEQPQQRLEWLVRQAPAPLAPQPDATGLRLKALW